MDFVIFDCSGERILWKFRAAEELRRVIIMARAYKRKLPQL
jgi:hypothetical protein